jgi:hypothetical protein
MAKSKLNAFRSNRQHRHAGSDGFHAVGDKHRNPDVKAAHDNEVAKYHEKDEKDRANKEKWDDGKGGRHPVTTLKRPSTMNHPQVWKDFQDVFNKTIAEHQKKYNLPKHQVMQDSIRGHMITSYRRLKALGHTKDDATNQWVPPKKKGK